MVGRQDEPSLYLPGPLLGVYYIVLVHIYMYNMTSFPRPRSEGLIVGSAGRISGISPLGPHFPIFLLERGARRLSSSSSSSRIHFTAFYVVRHTIQDEVLTHPCTDECLCTRRCTGSTANYILQRDRRRLSNSRWFHLSRPDYGIGERLLGRHKSCR